MEDEDVPTIQEPDEQRAKYSDKERETIPLEDFGDPERRAFPIVVAEDVIHAASRLHNASGSESAIKARIKKIAKRKGFPLPQTWQEEDGQGGNRAMEQSITTAHMYVPITRIDKDEWLIEGQATSDQIDSYGTVFDYESSKKAFQKWRGNIREMHQNKAVGRAVEVIPDDSNRLITVRARISRGAKDTWEKIVDGTLSGFSIGVPKNGCKTRMVERNGKSIPMFYDHELAEVSVVDNPGSPGCDISIVRADGIITDVLDDSETLTTPEPAPEETRAGAKISHVTQDALHGMRNNHLRNAQSTMKLCGCDECGVGCSALDPDDDGDIDILPSTDIDNDGGKPSMMAGGMRELEPMIMRALAPTIQRFNASLAQMAIHNQPLQLPEPVTIDTSAIERRLGEIETRYAELTVVRSLLSEVKEIVERVEKQPLPGGPITNGAAMDKILATRGQGSTVLSDADVIERAAQLGLLKSQESQIAGATVQIAQMLGQR